MAALALAPPAYSPPPPVPSYSQKPAADESTVEHTPRIREHPTGTYIKNSGGDAVVLADQDPTAEQPTYGRQGVISGFVSVDERETVSEIVLKVKGKMDVMISEGGSLSTKLINDSFTLWSAPKAHTSISPSAVPFSVAIPARFQDDDRISRVLPPSYELPCSSVPGFFFKSSYAISVTITRTRGRKLQFLSKTKTINIPFEYSPRSRPWRPIQPSSDFLSDVKTIPEEFRQVTWEVSPRPKSSAQALDLHLFLPAVEIFGLDDTIPFHIQLSGPVDALQRFLPLPDSASTLARTQKKQGITAALVRQLVVEVHGRRTTRQFVIGSGDLLIQPPSFFPFSHSQSAPSLDFSGTLRPRKNTHTGMFDVGAVRVQDFLVIELWPVEMTTLHDYQTMRYSHPVKLVTDSWVDSGASASAGMAMTGQDHR
ncbi:hypothetical protein C8F01DRAFT_1251889 [Mycena amicta]|nr:hypothetical protein C8F01DRAFT_1251889 [Mycena amicta]